MNDLTMPRCFLDADGVLADFEKLAKTICGMDSKQYEDRHGPGPFWKLIRNYRDPITGHGFFRSLELMPDAQALWDATKHLNPTILTGCPFGNWAPPQKQEWAAEKFGPNVKIITCMAKDKIRHLENPGDVLVDDKTKFQATWEAGGGIFVHHTDTVSTLARLREIHPIWFQRTDRWTPPS